MFFSQKKIDKVWATMPNVEIHEWSRACTYAVIFFTAMW